MNEMTNSHILVHEFAYEEPASLEEAVVLLSQPGRLARVLAGGTDLLVQMKMERVKPDGVISIRRIPGLDGVELREDGLHIGAMATIHALRNHPLVRRLYPALAQACASFSTTQVQVMGTIGGNLCNASPASDAAPALIVHEARAVLRGPDGERRLPVEDLFLGPGRSALGRGELLVELVLPLPASRSTEAGVSTGTAFLKISRVAADIAKANAAVMLARSGNTIVDCRLAFGSVAPRPFRARGAEACLIGQVYSPSLAAEAARIASEEIQPIDDVRSSAWYRRELVAVMARDGLEQAWARTQAEEARNGNGHGPAVEYARSAETLPRTESAAGGVRDGRLARAGGARREIRLTVNGVGRRLSVEPNDLLLNVLREDLELTGTKYGCGIGECSACTVEMDGRPVLACLVLAVSAGGSEIVTVEGLRKPSGELDPLQEAFLDNGAYQCGFCTPGMLMTARSLLRENPAPGEAEVRDHLKGNLCRCTGYASIVRAVMSLGEASPAGQEG